MDKTIYRLVNWDDAYTKRLLTDDELYFYSAKNWEQDGEYDFELGNFAVDQINNFIVDAAINMHNNDFPNYKHWIEVHAQEFGIDLASLTAAELDLVDQHLAYKIAEKKAMNPKGFIAAQKNIFFERTGIASFTKTKDSFSLWNFKRNQGSDNIVCIGIDANLLMQTLANSPNCIMNEVTYSNIPHKYEVSFDQTGHKTLLQLVKISFRIHDKFQDENEVRIQRLLIDNSQNSLERKVTLPGNIIKEIILLEDADANVQAEVFKLAKDKNIPKLQIAKLDKANQSVTISDT